MFIEYNDKFLLVLTVHICTCLAFTLRAYTEGIYRKQNTLVQASDIPLFTIHDHIQIPFKGAVSSKEICLCFLILSCSPTVLSTPESKMDVHLSIT